MEFGLDSNFGVLNFLSSALGACKGVFETYSC